jgi:lysylphosphatidylglycerol synthetase-like protein (DUF2156 family)
VKEVPVTLLKFLPLVTMLAVGIVLIVLGVVWFRRASGWMLRSLAALVSIVGVTYLTILAVAIGIHREPWTPLLVMVIVAVVLAAFIFWVSVLADCLLNEPNDGMGKLVWVLAIVLTFVIGAAIYHLGRRPRRIQEQTR